MNKNRNFPRGSEAGGSDELGFSLAVVVAQGAKICLDARRRNANHRFASSSLGLSSQAPHPVPAGAARWNSPPPRLRVMAPSLATEARVLPNQSSTLRPRQNRGRRNCRHCKYERRILLRSCTLFSVMSHSFLGMRSGCSSWICSLKPEANAEMKTLAGNRLRSYSRLSLTAFVGLALAAASDGDTITFAVTDTIGLTGKTSEIQLNPELKNE